MLTTVSTVLFLLLIAYLLWRKKYKKSAIGVTVFAVLSFFILIKAEDNYLATADAPIGERRLEILERSMLALYPTDAGKPFLQQIEQLTKDDGVFSNRDYERVKSQIPSDITDMVNQKFPNSAQEESALVAIVGE